jgi:hypothetical protein
MPSAGRERDAANLVNTNSALWLLLAELQFEHPVDPGAHRRGLPWHDARYQLTGDKTMRMQTAMIENGFVHIPETAPWCAEYLHELTGPRKRQAQRS